MQLRIWETQHMPLKQVISHYENKIRVMACFNNMNIIHHDLLYCFLFIPMLYQSFLYWAEPVHLDYQIASGPNFRGRETASLFPLSIIFSSDWKMDHNLEHYLEVGHIFFPK